MTYEIALVIIAAYIIAGISWNTLGIWQKWRSGDTVKIDLNKVKKNVIIGAVLGVIAYGVQISAAVTITAVTGVDSFIAVVIAAFPLIVVADRIFSKSK